MTFYPELAAAIEDQRRLKAQAFAEREERIKQVLRRDPERPNKELSRTFRCDVKYVARLRKGMANARGN